MLGVRRGHTLDRSASYYTHTHTTQSHFRGSLDNLMCMILGMVKTKNLQAFLQLDCLANRRPAPTEGPPQAWSARLT